MKEPKGPKQLSLTQSWTIFVRLLIQMKNVWEKHSATWAITPKDELERLPVEFQKFLCRNFNRSKFDIMLPRLVDYWRTIGGVEALQVKLPKRGERKDA